MKRGRKRNFEVEEAAKKDGHAEDVARLWKWRREIGRLMDCDHGQDSDFVSVPVGAARALRPFLRAVMLSADGNPSVLDALRAALTARHSRATRSREAEPLIAYLFRDDGGAVVDDGGQLRTAKTLAQIHAESRTGWSKVHVGNLLRKWRIAYAGQKLRST